MRTAVEPWQLDQAEKAVRLYFSHYLPLAGTAIVATEVKPDAMGNVRKVDVMDATRRLIQLRHYSHTTEQTYLGWMGRFFGYLASVTKPVREGFFKVTPRSQASIALNWIVASVSITTISIRAPLGQRRVRKAFGSVRG